MTTRQVKEGRKYQGVDEQIAYTLTTTPWGSSPIDVDVKIYDDTRTDKSSTCLNGSPSVNGDIITTPLVISLTARMLYRLEIKFTSSGNIFEAFCEILGES